ncbi:hypothetical protein AAFF_G00054960 [Aldrovandia affinis]|uniref:Uncharacterized protein n=1 Tax=Aldrovandia affinis TaxID=143900 RepID=A0AAD7S130_9TELE|nr:hypothetical protein AAFF_G00054960 [Aldrovandia affinis]
MHNRLKEEGLMEKVRSVEEAHGEHQYCELWRVINEMSVHKKAKEGQVDDDGPFTAAELAWVKSSLKQGKSVGADGIPLEVFHGLCQTSFRFLSLVAC